MFKMEMDICLCVKPSGQSFCGLDEECDSPAWNVVSNKILKVKSLLNEIPVCFRKIGNKQRWSRQMNTWLSKRPSKKHPWGPSHNETFLTRAMEIRIRGNLQDCLMEQLKIKLSCHLWQNTLFYKVEKTKQVLKLFFRFSFSFNERISCISYLQMWHRRAEKWEMDSFP